MRVVVLGGSGLLGRAVGDALVRRGHDVVAVSRSGSCGDAVAASGTVVRADLVRAAPAELDGLLTGADAAVWCLGPDDRAPLPAPAHATLERLLVEPTARAASAARRLGLRHFAVLGSYFTAFERLRPEWSLSRRHPYVRARVAQAATAEAAAPGLVSVLELPFVFGAVPGVEPMWKKVFFEPLRRSPIAFTLPGASAAVTHRDVATAAVALVEGAAPAGRYPLAVDNLEYRRFTDLVLDELGRRGPVLTLPAPLLEAGVGATSAVNRLRGLASGLDQRRAVRDVLARRLVLDPQEFSAPLGLTPGSVDEAVRETVRAAYGRSVPA